MGKRLSKIYTRSGDDGTTGLATGQRVDKHAERIVAIGGVDELNSQLGALIAALAPEEAWRARLLTVQHTLFDLGGELSLPEGPALVAEGRVARLERWLDECNADLPALDNFILPGGSPSAAQCHISRAVCRRAERDVVALSRSAAVRPELTRYLNRLSDLLFVLARALARRGDGEVLWQQSAREAS